MLARAPTPSKAASARAPWTCQSLTRLRPGVRPCTHRLIYSQAQHHLKRGKAIVHAPPTLDQRTFASVSAGRAGLDQRGSAPRTPVHAARVQLRRRYWLMPAVQCAHDAGLPAAPGARGAHTASLKVPHAMPCPSRQSRSAPCGNLLMRVRPVQAVMSRARACSWRVFDSLRSTKSA